jgi:hypothetical protein
MKIATHRNFIYVRTELRFTKREVDCLRRAAAIADEARDLLREHFGQVWCDESDVDMALAGIPASVMDLDYAGMAEKTGKTGIELDWRVELARGD